MVDWFWVVPKAKCNHSSNSIRPHGISILCFSRTSDHKWNWAACLDDKCQYCVSLFFPSEGSGGNLCQKCHKSFPDDQYSQHLVSTFETEQENGLCLISRQVISLKSYILCKKGQCVLALQTVVSWDMYSAEESLWGGVHCPSPWFISVANHNIPYSWV